VKKAKKTSSLIDKEARNKCKLIEEKRRNKEDKGRGRQVIKK
jgi:hypothetical protein